MLTTIAAAVAWSLVPAAPAAAGVRTCPPHTGLFNFQNRRQEYIADLTVRNMTCHQAIHALHNAYIIGWPPNLSIASFNCHMITGGEGGATDRCARTGTNRRFRVSIGT